MQVFGSRPAPLPSAACQRARSPPACEIAKMTAQGYPYIRDVCVCVCLSVCWISARRPKRSGGRGLGDPYSRSVLLSVRLSHLHSPNGLGDRDETWQTCAVRTSSCACPRKLRSHIPFSRKREMSLFQPTVPALGAIFSRMRADIKNRRCMILRNAISFEMSQFAAR